LPRRPKKFTIKKEDASRLMSILPVAAAALKAEQVESEDSGPQDHQIPPDGDWYGWMLLGGRGSGKTWAGSNYVLEHLRKYKRKARVGVGSATIQDVRETCMFGPSGLITMAPNEFTYTMSPTMTARHRDGGYVRFLGAEKAGRWNGPNWTLVWADELALWPEDTWDQALFGLRLPPDPRVIVTTTPKNRMFVRELLDDPDFVTVKATTYDNTKLAEKALKRFATKYEGTSIGRQELHAEFLIESDDQMFKYDNIAAHRVDEFPKLKKIVVAIDPHGSPQASKAKSKADKKRAQAGIAAAGIDSDDHIYILHSQGLSRKAEVWAAHGLSIWEELQANYLVAEKNYGGDMVRSVIQTAAKEMGVFPAFKMITAFRGKELRAEPVSMLYQQGKVHHVGIHTDLEEQLVGFPDMERKDILDALVYAVLELQPKFMRDSGLYQIESLDGSNKWRI
jgi:phage terminase large subunit-like protein